MDIQIKTMNSPLDLPDNWEEVIAFVADESLRRDTAQVNLVLKYSESEDIPIICSGNPITPEQEKVLSEAANYALRRDTTQVKLSYC